jgi:TRAP-type uncharacterized transport system fused permease subunit
MVLLIGWTVFQLYFNTLGVMDAITLRAYHALFLLMFTFLFYPCFDKEKRVRKFVPVPDSLLIILTVIVFGYMVLNYQRVAVSGGFLNQTDLIIAGISIVLVLEAGRRASRNLAVLSVIFLLFNWFGEFVPGTLGHSGFTLKRVLSHMFWGSQGIFGIGIGVSATYIFTFVLFGSFLKYSGFSRFINDIALTLVGRSAGGQFTPPNYGCCRFCYGGVSGDKLYQGNGCSLFPGVLILFGNYGFRPPGSEKTGS